MLSPARTLLLTLLITLGAGCAVQSESRDTEPDASASTVARVTDVSVSGASGSYSFAATVRSPDTGCDRYANWWEVVTPEGDLIHRRILLHSHVHEQPFTRSGGPVEIKPTQRVIVRVHVHPSGYSPHAQRGSVASGFEAVDLEDDFAAALADAPPQPSGCSF